jgi:DNA segregation ATPase FtsK/SpoIIIE, S-DNA-T family
MSARNRNGKRRDRRRPARHGYSIYDPVPFGIDEDGRPVAVTLMYRNLLAGGEPGSGKSSLLNTIIAHVSLCCDARLWLFDGKIVELGPWRPVADVFVGNDIHDALHRLRQLQQEMDGRYTRLDRSGRRKIVPADGLDVIVCVIDELAYFSVTIGTKEQQEEFKTLVRDLVARGRAAGIIMICATQRPSADIIPTSLRDLFGYRVAFRCTTDSSSDIILSVGWAAEGFSAKDIPPDDNYRGVGLLLAEGGIPRRFKAGYLDDDQIGAVIAYAKDLRGTAA